MGGGWDSKSHLRGAAIPRTSTWSTSSNHLSSTICACKNDYVNVTLGMKRIYMLKLQCTRLGREA